MSDILTIWAQTLLKVLVLTIILKCQSYTLYFIYLQNWKYA